MVGGESDTVSNQQGTGTELPLFKDGSAGAIEAHLNFITSDNADATASDTMDITGVVTLIWSVQGDE